MHEDNPERGPDPRAAWHQAPPWVRRSIVRELLIVIAIAAGAIAGTILWRVWT